MSRDVIGSLWAIALGIFVITLRRWLIQRYLINYDKTIRWLFGPPWSASRLEYWYIFFGIVFILVGVTRLASYLVPHSGLPTSSQ